MTDTKVTFTTNSNMATGPTLGPMEIDILGIGSTTNNMGMVCINLQMDLAMKANSQKVNFAEKVL